MTTLAVPSAPARAPLPYVAALGLLIAFSGYSAGGGSSDDGGYGASDAGGGCGGGAHAALGVVALGGVGAKACSRMARHGDEVAGLGGRALRGGSEVAGVGARNLDGAVAAFVRSDSAWDDVVGAVGERAIHAGEVPASVVTLHPELAGKLADPAALSAYAKANPKVYTDISVGVYLADPAAFQRLGTDALTAGASVSTPGFRSALTRAAKARMRTVAQQMKNAEAGALADIARQQGLIVETVSEGRVAVRMETPDYLVDLGELTLDVALEGAGWLLDDSDVELEPLSDRARFSDDAARRVVTKKYGQPARSYRTRDVGPLAAYMSGRRWVLVGPDLEAYALDNDKELAALFAALGAGEADTQLPIMTVLRVWGMRVGMQIMPPEPEGGWNMRPPPPPEAAPSRIVQEDGVLYAYSQFMFMPGEDPGRMGLFIGPDGSFEQRAPDSGRDEPAGE